MSEYMTGFTDIQWPIAGFIIFFVIFLVFIVLSFSPSEKRKYDKLELLPFEDNGKEVAP